MYLELIDISKMKLFYAKIVNHFRSVLDVPVGSECTSGFKADYHFYKKTVA